MTDSPVHQQPSGGEPDDNSLSNILDPPHQRARATDIFIGADD